MNEALIRKFLRNECSAEEARQVQKYLEEHPAELERYMGYSSWQEESGEEPVDPALSEKMIGEISRRAGVKPFRFRYRKILAVAASVAVLGLVSAGFWRYYSGTDKSTPAKKHLAYQDETAKDSLIVKANRGRGTMPLALPDGSKVELAAGSRVSYRKAFDGDRRDVFLEGEALFRVAEDKERPFTVYAGNLATTALGTVFRISAPREGEETVVRLLSGKVVVKPDSLLSAHGLKEVYLSPGKELLVNTERFSSSLKDVGQAAPKKAPKTGKKTTMLKPGRVIISDTAIVFKKHPLPLVFKDLEALYGTSLDFDEDVLRKILFTGEYRREKDSLEQVLQSIALLNELEVSRSRRGYRIEKK